MIQNIVPLIKTIGRSGFKLKDPICWTILASEEDKFAPLGLCIFEKNNYVGAKKAVGVTRSPFVLLEYEEIFWINSHSFCIVMTFGMEG